MLQKRLKKRVSSEGPNRTSCSVNEAPGKDVLQELETEFATDEKCPDSPKRQIALCSAFTAKTLPTAHQDTQVAQQSNYQVGNALKPQVQILKRPISLFFLLRQIYTVPFAVPLFLNSP